MSDDYRHDQQEMEFYCEDCRILIDALRDMEDQCREAEDQRLSTASIPSISAMHQTVEDEMLYLGRLEKLQRRRDCALEVLLKHQRLEHPYE